MIERSTGSISQGRAQSPGNWGPAGILTPIPRNIILMAGELFNLTTADEVAQYLRNHGIKGERWSLGACPLANLFAVERVEFAEVDPEGINVKFSYTVDGEEHIESAKAEYSEAMREFVENFDKGMYPDLESPTEESELDIEAQDLRAAVNS